MMCQPQAYVAVEIDTKYFDRPTPSVGLDLFVIGSWRKSHRASLVDSLKPVDKRDSHVPIVEHIPESAVTAVCRYLPYAESGNCRWRAAFSIIAGVTDVLIRGSPNTTSVPSTCSRIHDAKVTASPMTTHRSINDVTSAAVNSNEGLTSFIPKSNMATIEMSPKWPFECELKY